MYPLQSAFWIVFPGTTFRAKIMAIKIVQNTIMINFRTYYLVCEF